jgi:LPXTG-site transpeptidase (sortase) family protein
MASALGLALVVGGGVVVARAAAPATAPGHAPTRTAPAFDIERPVRLEPATAPAHARGRSGRSPATSSDAAGPPQRLVIDALGVDAPVVGIDAPGGVLRPPDDPQVLGWWRAGATPGAARGSALVTGHTVSSGGGAFDDLETLRSGDRLSVRTAAGVIGYEVGSVTVYRKARLARRAATIFSQEVPGRVVLITCEDWNGTTYESNVVVTAHPRTGDR